MSEPRVYPWLMALVLLGLMLSPLARPASDDSFPFSSYPMFAHARDNAETVVDRAVAHLEDGRVVPLPPRALGTDEVLQAAATLRQAIRRGRRGNARLCAAIAARIAGDPDYAGATEVEILSERYDALAYFAGDTAPLSPPTRRARCKVPAP